MIKADWKNSSGGLSVVFVLAADATKSVVGPEGDIAAALQKNRAGLTIADDADLSHLGGSRCAILESMLGLRKLLRARRSGSLLALTVAYSLAVQAMMASVGFSMSAPDQGGHVICSFTSGPSAHTPATSGDRQNPGPQPHCPFCFIAAQSAGLIATMGEALAFPAYAGMQIADKFSVHIGDKALVSQFRARGLSKLGVAMTNAPENRR